MTHTTTWKPGTARLNEERKLYEVHFEDGSYMPTLPRNTTFIASFGPVERYAVQLDRKPGKGWVLSVSPEHYITLDPGGCFDVVFPVRQSYEFADGRYRRLCRRKKRN